MKTYLPQSLSLGETMNVASSAIGISNSGDPAKAITLGADAVYMEPQLLLFRVTHYVNNAIPANAPGHLHQRPRPDQEEGELSKPTIAQIVAPTEQSAQLYPDLASQSHACMVRQNASTSRR